MSAPQKRAFERWWDLSPRTRSRTPLPYPVELLPLAEPIHLLSARISGAVEVLKTKALVQESEERKEAQEALADILAIFLKKRRKGCSGTLPPWVRDLFKQEAFQKRWRGQQRKKGKHPALLRFVTIHLSHFEQTAHKLLTCMDSLGGEGEHFGKAAITHIFAEDVGLQKSLQLLISTINSAPSDLSLEERWMAFRQEQKYWDVVAPQLEAVWRQFAADNTDRLPKGNDDPKGPRHQRFSNFVPRLKNAVATVVGEFPERPVPMDAATVEYVVRKHRALSVP